MVQVLTESLVQWVLSLLIESLQVKKLPGQMGNVTRTVQNLEIVAVDVENNVLLISGSIPGPKKGLVVVKTAVKANGKVNPAEDLIVYETKKKS